MTPYIHNKFSILLYKIERSVEDKVKGVLSDYHATDKIRENKWRMKEYSISTRMRHAMYEKVSYQYDGKIWIMIHNTATQTFILPTKLKLGGEVTIKYNEPI